MQCIMNDTLFYTEYRKVFATGYVNVRTDHEWHPFYFHKDSETTLFGVHEANVTCKDGGYSRGTYVTNEFDTSQWPWLKYISVVCTGQEHHLTDCSYYHVRNYNHYRNNVEVKCYF